MGAFEAYRAKGGPLRVNMYVLHVAEGFDPLVLADDPDPSVEPKVKEIKNGHLAMFSMCS